MHTLPAHKNADAPAGQIRNVVTIGDYVANVQLREANLVPTALPPAEALKELLEAVDNHCRALRVLRPGLHITPHMAGCTRRLDLAIGKGNESLAEVRRLEEHDRRQRSND